MGSDLETLEINSSENKCIGRKEWVAKVDLERGTEKELFSAPGTDDVIREKTKPDCKRIRKLQLETEAVRPGKKVVLAGTSLAEIVNGDAGLCQDNEKFESFGQVEPRFESEDEGFSNYENFVSSIQTYSTQQPLRRNEMASPEGKQTTEIEDSTGGIKPSDSKFSEKVTNVSFALKETEESLDNHVLDPNPDQQLGDGTAPRESNNFSSLVDSSKLSDTGNQELGCEDAAVQERELLDKLTRTMLENQDGCESFGEGVRFDQNQSIICSTRIEHDEDPESSQREQDSFVMTQKSRMLDGDSIPDGENASFEVMSPSLLTEEVGQTSRETRDDANPKEIQGQQSSHISTTDKAGGNIIHFLGHCRYGQVHDKPF
jgi:hypothetical protein